MRPIIQEIQADIVSIEQNASLFETSRFGSRADALDQLEFHVIDRIAGLLQAGQPPAALVRLQRHAQRVKQQLQAIDTTLFEQLRADIRTGRRAGRDLRDLIHSYVGCDSGDHQHQDQRGYDNLDLFLNGLLPIQETPLETIARESEMVFYQKTPARIIFEILDQAHFTTEDVFYDLGSGLGHVPILVNLLGGASAKGVEYEPSYCDYARRCARDLNLPRVEFIHADARTLNYADGTAFFLFTPFMGNILRSVLEALRIVGQRRRIKIFTYGPCTIQVAQQPWLTYEAHQAPDVDRLGIFHSSYGRTAHQQHDNGV